MSQCLFCSRRTVKLDMSGRVPTMEYCRDIFESCNKYLGKELKGNHFKWNYTKEWPIQFCSICLEFSDELFRIDEMLRTHIQSFSKYIRTRAKVHENHKVYVSHSHPEKCNNNENRRNTNEDEDHIINIMSGTPTPNVFPKMEPEEQDMFLDEAEIKTEFVETFDDSEEGFLAAPLHIELSSNYVSIPEKKFPVNYLTNVQDQMIVVESNNVSEVMEENQLSHSQPLEESSKQASISFTTLRKQKHVFNCHQIVTDSIVHPNISEANAKNSIKTSRNRKIKINRGRWHHEEDEKLKSLVATYGDGNWKEIAKNFPDRSQMQCATRWAKVLSPSIIKGQWSREEDEKIVQLVAKNGPCKWTLISKHLKGRIGKQCRERWTNHLNPEINKDPWTEDEDRMIYEAHCKYGNQWSTIATFLPGRTDNSIKNRWNCTIKRKMADFYVKRKRGEKKKVGEI